MTVSIKREWFIPSGLIALSVIPVVAGVARLGQLAGGTTTPENARFFAAPLPAVVHIASVTLYCLLGAFQFAPNFRHRHPQWHRAAGRVLVLSGLLAALSGMWMAQFFPAVNYDGPILWAIRLVVGTAMIVFIGLGYAAILRRDIFNHRSWMMRSYALGLGAGTQVFTHIPWFIFPSIQGELARTLFMAAGWAINLTVVEWILCRERHR